MIITRRSLPRRTFLRGAGTAVALPWLDAMTPALAAPNRSGSGRALRVAFLYVPNGIIMKDWTPKADGAAFEFPRTLKPVEPFRDRLLVLTGLDHYNGQSLGDGAGDHARAGATWLTGVHPKKTQGADIHAGISVDQVAAKTTDPAARAAQARRDRSILDFVRQDAARLGLGLGAGDRRKLGEYLDAVREIERRIQKAEGQDPEASAPTSIDRPAGIPPTFEEHCQLMFDLMTVAFQADLTRVVTFMMGREGGNRTYRSIGVPDAHHGLSHHFGDPSKVERLQKIDQHHVDMLSYFLGKLQAAKDGDGSLLDRSLIVYGSSLSDGNRHQHDDLPTLLAGGAAAKVQGGRHLRYKRGTPMTNLYLSLLDLAGVRPEKVGDSTGKVEHLSSL
ncbi:MAG: DUF1552 domain-containing protein [Acidobacteria bacterium]|nr:DUF1552 domain-containing protein [Acidobacteriota bacterium]